MNQDELKVCAICDVTFKGWGHNPAPFPGGRCCDDCNHRFVIPARMAPAVFTLAHRFLGEDELALVRYFATMGRKFSAGFKQLHKDGSEVHEAQ